jgi:hypothetical protein
MTPIFHNTSEKKRFGVLLFASFLLSCLSFVILFLEYGVFNFGDSDLPPYQPDTLFQRAFDVAWFTVTAGAVLGWLSFIIYVSALLFRSIKRRVA